MSSGQPVLNATLIDWLTIATFNPIDYFKVTAAIEHTYHKWRPKKWMQYTGRESACGIFHGMGEQKKMPHCVIKVSGQFAHIFYEWFRKLDTNITSSFYCTRIDLQRTQIRLDKEYRITAYKRMRGKKRLIQDPSGITLYVGARTSDTFWRIYDKTEEHLRLEVELKGKLSKRAYQAIIAGESLGGILNRFLFRSKVPKIYADYFRADSEPALLPDLEELENISDKLQWLSTLDALVYKLANDHDTAERTARLIERWHEYCTKLDTKTE